MYARIKDGIVIGVMHSLPSSHENISGFDNLTDAEVAAHGFLPLVEVKPVLTQHTIPLPAGANGEDNNVYIPSQTYGQPVDTIIATKVTRTYPVIQRTATDINGDICRIRASAYPPIADYADAQVKKSSPDPVVQKAGTDQEAKYFNDCFAVKLKYPK